MSRPLVNVAAPILGMAVLGALLGLCWRDPLWFFVMVPVLLAFSGFASGYGCKGETFEQASANAAAVLFLTGVLSALIFLFTVAPETF
ncbi:hypothetical protein BABAJAGA_00710 [Brevundimonas phage vB_BgoS-BabaJaga]|nr:hypothetical protein BABAJAGA_00710 [Brevundimonas phage vB_BgoS-BabaJaga]